MWSAAHWLKQTLVLALADGRLLSWQDGAISETETHGGGLLCTCSDGEQIDHRWR